MYIQDRFVFERFLTERLSRQINDDNLNIYFAEQDYSFSKNILEFQKNIFFELNQFFKDSFFPNVHLFLYPSKEEMDKAFQRVLPNPYCCFVPYKNDKEAVITFTSLNSKDALQQIFTHEMSHIFFNKITGNKEINIIQQTIPMWLDEGIALFLDFKYRKNKENLILKRISFFEEYDETFFPKENELYTYFNRLDEGQEFGPKGTLAYVYSFFCIKFLIESFGQNNMILFLKSLYKHSELFDKLFFDVYSFKPTELYLAIKNLLFSKKYNGESINLKILLMQNELI